MLEEREIKQSEGQRQDQETLMQNMHFPWGWEEGGVVSPRPWTSVYLAAGNAWGLSLSCIHDRVKYAFSCRAGSQDKLPMIASEVPLHHR